MYPTIEALRQTSKAGVFLICFLAYEERARRARLVTEFDEGYSVREGKADRNSLLKLIIQIEHDAICSQYYFIAVHFLITSLRRAQPFFAFNSVASASKRTDEIQTRDNFLTLLPVGYAANRFATALSTPSPLQPPTLRGGVDTVDKPETANVHDTPFDQIKGSNPVSLQIVTGDPLCSGEHNSERVTPNRRHFLDAHGDTPGCQALLELGIREHERKTPS
ncbi:hypothetical protein ALC57_01743 [Trachymyrmex cornetzi]|uniref:Uncharacterized protein n=1 Tax=Trachymyrmex cornetzi TaxID=471704 RepID=A0A195EKI5_9HYME|nr:hypothetical protein ALC57_01743 [Trachymyrmex cornetzi]